MKARLTKHDIMRTIQQAGQEAAHVGNLILCWHRRPWTKLRGLALLVSRGHAVRTGQFDLDILVIDGERAPWQRLETVR